MLFRSYDLGAGSGVTAPLTWDPERREILVLTSGGNLMSFKMLVGGELQSSHAQ